MDEDEVLLYGADGLPAVVRQPTAQPPQPSSPPREGPWTRGAVLAALIVEAFSCVITDLPFSVRCGILVATIALLIYLAMRILKTVLFRLVASLAGVLIASGFVISASMAHQAQSATEFSLSCSTDARLDATKTASGKPLPSIVDFVTRNASFVEATDSLLPQQDQDGYLFQIRSFFKRCELLNSGGTDATNIRFSMSSRAWDPVAGQWLDAPSSADFSIAQLQKNRLFEFGITNHGMIYSLQQNPNTIRYHSGEIDREASLHTDARTVQILSQTLPDQPLQKTPFRHFSKCHFAFSMHLEAHATGTFTNVPPECSPNALKKESLEHKNFGL